MTDATKTPAEIAASLSPNQRQVLTVGACGSLPLLYAEMLPPELVSIVRGRGYLTDLGREVVSEVSHG